jgi:DNA-directed RNA polymerase beta' subunit
MILFNETVSIENAVAEEWLQWMQETHVPEVMATTFFIKFQIAKVMEDEDTGGTTYAVQYYARHMDDLLEYHRDHDKIMQGKMQAKFAGQYAAFRTVLTVVA